MTAINIIRQNHAVHVVSDGAHYGGDGNLWAVGPKVFPLPHIDAVFAVRGPKIGLAVMAELLGSYAGGFDDLRTRISRMFADEHQFRRDLFEGCAYGSEMDVVVAGWSETEGPCAYIVCSHSLYNLAPWTVHSLGEFAMAPGDAASHAELINGLPPDATVDTIDVEREAVRMIEIQRKIRLPHPEIKGGIFAIGAFVMLTTVTKDLVASKILKRFPDKVGRQIEG